MTYFQSERLFFRNWEDSDKDAYIRLVSDSKIMEFFPKPLCESEAIGEMYYLDDKLTEKGYGIWAVGLLSNNQIIGRIGLKDVDFEAFFAPSIEIGWRLLPEFWGQGYASEAAKRIIEWAIKEKKICKEIVSFAVKDNINSQKVMQSIGMSYQGEFLHPFVDAHHPLSRHILYKTNI